MKLNICCEYMEHAFDIPQKEFKILWNYERESETDMPEKAEQTGYQILTGRSREKVEAGHAELWDSGYRRGKEVTCASYEGADLYSGQTFYIRVIGYLSDGRKIESKILHCRMGLLDKEEWKGTWITGPTPEKATYWFRKEILITEKVKHAIAFIVSPGYYILTVNGTRPDDSVLNPAWTDARKTVPVRSFEITDLLINGKNTIGAECGYGWHNPQRSETNVGWGDNAFSMMLLLEYEDGSREWKYSDPKGWYYSTEGPLKNNSIYHGEIYDHNQEIRGWDENDYEMDGRWKKAVEHEPMEGIVRAQHMEPIRVTEELRPRKIYEAGDGSYTFDFGQNFAGWVKLKIKGKKGQQIILKYAELIHKDGSINSISLRRAKATDIYTLSGEGEETYEPGFTYHGFRYVQVYGLQEPPKPELLTGRVVHSDVKRIGKFTCSNDLMNRLYQNIIWTEKSNLHGLPTDCPQRDERLGWLNDMTVRCECAMYNFRLIQLYSKWMQDIQDTQGKHSGAITDTAPFIRYGLMPGDPVDASFLLIPWNIYLHYGDTRLMEKHYLPMKKWADYLWRNSDEGIVRYSQMGDWAAPVGETQQGSLGSGSVSATTPTTLIGTGYLYFDCILLSKMAEILGLKKDVEVYRQRADLVRETFQKEYYHEKEGYYANNSQAGNVLPLYFGMVSKEDRKSVLKNIIDDVKKHDNHLTTGNLCSRYLMEVLFENGEQDLAYELLTQETYPGWGYMLKNGATTMWERWEKVEEEGPLSRMASHNHPMNGAVGVCFHKYLAGIRPDEANPGFQNVIIKPVIPQKLSFVHAELETIKGIVKSEWEKKTDGLYLKISIPLTMTADVYLPKKNGYEKLTVGAGEYCLKGDQL